MPVNLLEKRGFKMLISEIKVERKCLCGSTCFSIKIGEYDESHGLIFDKYTCKSCGMKYILTRCPCKCLEDLRIDPDEKQPIRFLMSSFFFVYDPKQDD